jgi:DnaK suppressor protein
MLNTKQREEIRALIESVIAEQETMIEHLQETTAANEEDSSVGRLSRMDTLVNRGTNEMMVDNARKRIERLRNRLAKIDDADFDKCGKCGTKLTIQRLRAAPDRGVCATCLKG